MIGKIDSILDLKFVSQSAPSLLISLVGMLFTSYSFKQAVEHKNLKTFPFFFQSSSILGFNGNIELGYVMHLSTKRKTMANLKDFKRIAIANSCFLLFESCLIGLLVGILSILSVYSQAKITLTFALKMITTSSITCFITTLMFIVAFLFSLELVVYFSINPESFLMPVLNGINDIIVVKILYTASINIENYSIYYLFYVISIIMILACICLYFSFYNTDPIPNLSLDTVVITFLLNLFSGLLVDRCSPYFPMIAPAYPVFTGMGASIAYIFLHKRYISIRCQESINCNLKITLCFISLIISGFYIFISSYCGIRYTHTFSLGFIFMFALHVLVLLKITDFILKIYIENQKSISANTVPIVTSVSDAFGIIALLFISYCISLL